MTAVSFQAVPSFPGKSEVNNESRLMINNLYEKA